MYQDLTVLSIDDDPLSVAQIRSLLAQSAFREARIHLSVRERNNDVILSVKDNGMGIDLSRNGNKIFGLYQRFHGDGFPGRGMGLHLVKTHVETMGGEIEIESKVNEGTEFRVILPNNYEQTTA